MQHQGLAVNLLLFAPGIPLLQNRILRLFSHIRLPETSGFVSYSLTSLL